MTNLKVILIEHWYSNGRTDSDLARAIQVDQSLVSRWVAGISVPPIERRIQIANAIGVDSALIFSDE